MNLDDKIKYLQQFYQADKLTQLNTRQLNSLYELSQPKSVPIASLATKPVDSYLVHSADGYVPVIEWRNKGQKECVELHTSGGKKITASVDHFFEMHDGKWKYAEYIFPGEKVVTTGGIEVVTHVKFVGSTTVYDFHIGHENHRYFTNGISSHNSGSGKSLFMQNLAVNWSEAGLNGVYITLELSEELTAWRIDSMLTGVATKEVFKRIDEVTMKVAASAKRANNKPGMLRIKYLPAQSTVNDIRAFLKELTIQTGKTIDFILVDYLDLLMPVSAKVSPNDLFVKDKYASEELRNLSKEWNAVMVTASQLNRSAVEEIEFNHSHISGGISKINTADNVFGIFTSRAMRDTGRYQLQPMKTRNSGSVGIRIDLAFDVNTLKISDSPDYVPGYQPTQQSSMSDQIMSKIKQPSSSSVLAEPIPTETGDNVKGQVQSARLKAMLNSLKTTE